MFLKQPIEVQEGPKALQREGQVLKKTMNEMQLIRRLSLPRFLFRRGPERASSSRPVLRWAGHFTRSGLG